MPTFQPFVRSLGNQPGVQLNPPIDKSVRPASSTADQVFAGVGRFQRGPIDRAIRVTRSNVNRVLGPAASIRLSPENEAGIQIREALENGSREAIVARLVGAAAAKSFAVIGVPSGDAQLTAAVTGGVVTAITVVAGKAGKGYRNGDWVTIGGPGTGAKAQIAVDATGAITGVTGLVGGTGYTTAPTVTLQHGVWFSTSATVPAANGNWAMYLDDGNCWNSGLILSLHADRTPISGTATASTNVTLRVIDPLDNTVVQQVSGSLSMTATDAGGRSMFLPDVLKRADPTYTLVVANAVTIPTTSNAYGRSGSADQWATSAVLSLFSEGAITYNDTIYEAAVRRLTMSSRAFGYVATLGTKVPSLVRKLAELAVAMNVPFTIDVDGKLTYQGAIDYVAGLGLNAQFDHLFSAYWAPIEAYEPYNGYHEVWGVSGLQVGMRCARNAKVDAKGFAPKQQPIAGHNFIVPRAEIRQLVAIDDPDFSDLADGGVNPVAYYSYGGGGYMFGDALTLEKNKTSDLRLISCGEIEAHIGIAMSDYARSLTLGPIDDAVTDMTDFANAYLAAAQAAKWLTPAENGKAFIVNISKRANAPKSIMDVEYWISCQGTLRQVFIQPVVFG